jgi:2-polyprenyl-3-methyl-5-hydroxy-6-metoxy-1,4-benzoquinol methylase
MNYDIFTDYYKNNIWLGRESVSGQGSDHEQVIFLIPELEILFKDLKIKSILDIPCGDFNWMKNVDLKEINYHGADVVEDLIKSNNIKYKADNVNFSVINIVTDLLPKVDLIIVRDCLVHLPTSEIFKALKNIKNSQSKYLLTTHNTWIHRENNVEINLGEWRRINLQQSPYNFKYPERILIEGNTVSLDRDKTMSLWNIQDIPDQYGDNNGI